MDESVVPEQVGILKDGRLGTVGTQSSIIDAILVDADHDMITDQDGNFLTE